MAYSFVRGLLNVAPVWLLGKNGSAILTAIGEACDVIRDRAAQSVRRRFPNVDSDDSLALICAERRIRRGPGESAAAIAARLEGWLDVLPRVGIPGAMLEQIQAHYASRSNFEVQLIQNQPTPDPSYLAADAAFYGGAAVGTYLRPEGIVSATNWTATAGASGVASVSEVVTLGDSQALKITQGRITVAGLATAHVGNINLPWMAIARVRVEPDQTGDKAIFAVGTSASGNGYKYFGVANGTARYRQLNDAGTAWTVNGATLPTNTDLIVGMRYDGANITAEMLYVGSDRFHTLIPTTALTSTGTFAAPDNASIGGVLRSGSDFLLDMTVGGVLWVNNCATTSEKMRGAMLNFLNAPPNTYPRLTKNAAGVVTTDRVRYDPEYGAADTSRYWLYYFTDSTAADTDSDLSGVPIDWNAAHSIGKLSEIKTGQLVWNQPAWNWDDGEVWPLTQARILEIK